MIGHVAKLGPVAKLGCVTRRFPNGVGIKCSVIKPAYNPYIIHISSIYKEISINIYLNNQKHRRRLRRPPHWVCVSDYFFINIYGYSLYMDDVWMIYG